MEVGINMDVNNLQAGMPGTAASGISVSCTRSSSKTKSGKKSLSYNPREISSQIMRSKRMTGASQVLIRARAKVAMLRRAKATGEYDSAEIDNALAHAKRMVECADKKVNNLREEDRLKKKAERKAEQTEERIRNAERLECLKRSTHRRDENKEIMDANMKYYQRAYTDGTTSAAGSSYASSVAASLEITSAAGGMQSLKIAEAAMTQTSSSVDVLV